MALFLSGDRSHGVVINVAVFWSNNFGENSRSFTPLKV
ncbi:phage baseplate assembly protein [Candidatus Williamhamiltonella defendens]|nr:phage baseplate assembly protein [Candidatus Hamiltonella defensa]